MVNHDHGLKLTSRLVWNRRDKNSMETIIHIAVSPDSPNTSYFVSYWLLFSNIELIAFL